MYFEIGFRWIFPTPLDHPILLDTKCCLLYPELKLSLVGLGWGGGGGGKGVLGICEYLVDDYKLGIEASSNSSDMATLLLDMIDERSMVKFPHKVEFLHWGSIVVNTRYLF